MVKSVMEMGGVGGMKRGLGESSAEGRKLLQRRIYD